MIFLFLWFPLLTNGVIGENLTETQARLKLSASELLNTEPCNLLISRSRKYWENGLFSHCNLVQIVEHEANTTEAIFNVQVNDSVLLDGLNATTMLYDFKMWHINRLLNGEDQKQCNTAVGDGHWTDSHTTSTERIDHVARERFILVAPYSDSFCDLFSHQSENQHGIYVLNCETVEVSTSPIDGFLLAKYRLFAMDTRWHLTPSTHVDNHIFLLHDLNGDFGQCLVNGYWATAHTIVSTQVHFLPWENATNEEPTCELLKSLAPERWQSGLFTDCILDTEGNQQLDVQRGLFFHIKVNVSQMPSDFELGMQGDYLSWYVNRLINGPGAQCLTVTGGSTPQNNSAESHDFTLVGPYVTQFCPMLLDYFSPILTTNDTTCKLVHKMEKSLDGTQVAKYRISAENIIEDAQQFQSYIIQELNKHKKECSFNGFWTERFVPLAMNI